jgi:DSF synthase
MMNDTMIDNSIVHLPVASTSRAEADAGVVSLGEHFSELDLDYDKENRILWQFMAPHNRPSFTTDLVCEMTEALNIAEIMFKSIDFLVLASRIPGIFNLGGDLRLFESVIKNKDEDSLRKYAHACAIGQHRRAIGLGLPICTIALIQGDAMGGGFEAALAHDVIIAERGVKFGFPEIRFNMLPGMGAFSFLTRRIGPIDTERIISSGKTYSAEEMQQIGLVDRLVEEGDGIDAVRMYTREFRSSRCARLAMLKARKIVSPISLMELISIADLWVETALKLGPIDLRKMHRIWKAQDRKWESIGGYYNVE